MKCEVCGEKIEGSNFFRPPVVLENGVVHFDCHERDKRDVFAIKFPNANEEVYMHVHEDLFANNKYCLVVGCSDFDDNQNDRFYETEYFNDITTMTDYLNNEIFCNSEWQHKWVHMLHIDQKKEKLVYNTTVGLNKPTVDFELDDIWSLSTDKVQEIYDDIINSYHYKFLTKETKEE